jgi:hypothetical protein
MYGGAYGSSVVVHLTATAVLHMAAAWWGI